MPKITNMVRKSEKKIAIVAGALRLPFLVRDALRARGWDVFVIGLKNFYDAKLNPDMVIRIGGAGAAIHAARRTPAASRACPRASRCASPRRCCAFPRGR